MNKAKEYNSPPPVYRARDGTGAQTVVTCWPPVRQQHNTPLHYSRHNPMMPPNCSTKRTHSIQGRCFVAQFGVTEPGLNFVIQGLVDELWASRDPTRKSNPLSTESDGALMKEAGSIP